ncbi:hypothetical protein HDU97_008921 [Phlyctochytrium planicorne]|nr:hypothetical protein HDU97_008921 [Phlyctochytrium planicorne]
MQQPNGGGGGGGGGAPPRPRFQPPPQSNVLGNGGPINPYNPSGGPQQRFNMPPTSNGFGAAMRQASVTSSIPSQNRNNMNLRSNNHLSLYSEFGGTIPPSEYDSSDVTSNRDSVEFRDEARRMAEELFASSSLGDFNTETPQLSLGLGDDQAQAPVRKGGVGMTHINAPTKSTFTETSSDVLFSNVQASGSVGTNTPVSAASPYVQGSPLQQNGSLNGGVNGINNNWTGSPQSMGGVGGQGPNNWNNGGSGSTVGSANNVNNWSGSPSNFSSSPNHQQESQHLHQSSPSQTSYLSTPPHANNNQQPRQQQQQQQQQQQPSAMQRSYSSQEGQKQLMTMDDEDRFVGYPPPGDLIPEHERDPNKNQSNNTGTRSLTTVQTAPSQRSLTPTSLQPTAEDLMAVIFSGHLFKQNRRGQFQKRLFRFDGLLLICLAPKRHRLPDHINLLTFDPARHTRSNASGEFMAALGRFYPTNPPMPALTNPLIASYQGENASGSNPDIYTKYYHMPKWIIPTASMQSIQTPSASSKDPESKAARTFIIRTQSRDYVLRASTAAEFRRWTFLLSRMSAAGGDAASVMNGSGGNLVRDNDEDDDDESDNEDGGEQEVDAQNQPYIKDQRFGGPPVVDLLHPSLARMGTWQRSVADLLGRDQDAGTNVMSVSNSEGVATIERGLSNRMSRLTFSSTQSSDLGYYHPSHPPTHLIPPVPALPSSIPTTRPTRSDSLSSRSRSRSNSASSTTRQPFPQQPVPPVPPLPANANQRSYPMPVPLRPDQLQPPNGRIMKGPTIFGAAIAAGVHPTTPLMPGAKDVIAVEGSGSPTPGMGRNNDSVPLKKGASIRQMNRTQDRMSIISSDGFAIPASFPTKPVTTPYHPSPLSSMTTTSLRPQQPQPQQSQQPQLQTEPPPILLDPQTLQDLDKSCQSLLRILRRIQGDDTDETSPNPLTRRNPTPTNPLQSTLTIPYPTPLTPPTYDFIHRFTTISVPHFTHRIRTHLQAGGRRALVEKMEEVDEEWRLGVVDRVLGCGETGEVRGVMGSRVVVEVFGRLVECVEEVRRVVVGGQQQLQGKRA